MTVHVINDDSVVAALYAAGAVGFDYGQVKRFKNGILSPGAYLDCRRLQSHPAAWDTVLGAMRWASDSSVAVMDIPEPDVVAAVASAGIAHGAALARELWLPHVIVKKEEKTTHGLGGRIDGDTSVLSGATVVLIEDMSSTFTSTREAMEPLAACDATVVHTIAISTWGFPEFYQNAAGHTVTALSTGEQLVEHAIREQMVGPEYAELLFRWLKDPDDQSWINDEWEMPV